MARRRPGEWGGRKVTEAREWLTAVTAWPVVCGHPGCGKLVALDDDWVVGHAKARATHPELTWEPSNWRVEHRKCSDSSGQAVVIEKAKRDALRDAAAANQPALFSLPESAKETPPLPLYTSASPTTEDDADQVKPEPLATVRDELIWNPEYLRQFDWLAELADVPEDASPPLAMTPVPADAVGSYGWIAIEWIEANVTPRVTLRWWQKLSLVRQLEHRANGSLCWRVKVESAPRRAGKSVGLRSHALWRMEHGRGMFGETQTVIHTGSDIPICREIQRGAWAWAEAREGWDVKRGAGQETIESPDDARWMVRSQDGVYGYDATVGMVDEGWNVRPDTVSEGLEPAMLERSNPQLILTSTAHRRATSLMRTWLVDAMTMNDPTVLLLLWAAPLGSDPGDPAVWRAASPHWSEDRRAMIASKYEKALAGQDDPEFDDPDPMRGFEAQYLNIWRIAEVRTVGNPITTAEEWDTRTTDDARALVATTLAPDAIAVEAWFGAGVAVARAWKSRTGTVVVHVTDYPDLPTAARTIATWAHRRRVLVGATLADHATWKTNRIRVTKMATSTRASVGELIRAMADRGFLHTGAGVLTDQVLNLRVSDGIDGPRIRSTGRADAIKSAMWAVQQASTIRRQGTAMPSRFTVNK